MTKSERQQIERLLDIDCAAVAARTVTDAHTAMMARSFSAMHRACMTNKGKADILHAARLVHCAWHPEFII